MPRTSTAPRYYKSKNGWFGTFGGERIRLTTGAKTRTEQEAKERYEAERSARKVETEGDRNTVWAILNAYILDCENRVKNDEMAESTLKMHRSMILPFNEKCGALQVRNLRPQHINDFLAEMRQPRWNEQQKRELKWEDATIKLARNVLKTAFIWAVGEGGLISTNPFDRKGKGKRKKRSRRRPSKSRIAIWDNEHAQMLKQANKRSKKGFAHLLMFLYGTGARPAEMYLATAQEWNEDKKAFVIKAVPESRGRFKLAYLGEDRIVYIPDSLVPLARELMAMYPTGPIFRTESGKAWNNGTLCARFKCTKNAINSAAAKNGAAGVRKALTAYGYRHAFVTRWIVQGRRLERLCELLNTSETMIREHYSHLFEETTLLRESLDDFDQGMEVQPATSSVPDLVRQSAMAF